VRAFTNARILELKMGLIDAADEHTPSAATRFHAL
jgi:hypothetical protein